MWAEHTEVPNGLDDLVNYAAPIAPGVLRLKDRAMVAAFYCAGPDLSLASEAELERLSAQTNDALLHCGTGWMIHYHVARRVTRDYLPIGAFPHATPALIDEDRRRFYQREPHYESVHALALTYLPPQDVEQELTGLLYEGPEQHRPRQEFVLQSFLQTLTHIEEQLSSVLRLSRMNDEELLTYLHFCVTGHDHPVRVPSVGVDWDSIIADQELIGGFQPRIGDLHVRAVSVDGFPPLSQPGAQAFLHELPQDYLWCIRFIGLDVVDAQAVISTKQKHWWQQRRSLTAKWGEMASGASDLLDQEDPLQMARDANEAAAEAASGTVLFGLYTMTVLVMDEDAQRVEQKARAVRQQIHRCGFGARIERANTMEAIAGVWPGHGYQNVRRVLIHSLNLADLLPLTNVWPGLATNPNPYFPKNSPPLMLTATSGQTPFRLNLDVHDVGHGWILGPTGSGKSTLLVMLMAQWQRYPHAQIFAFDKGYSAFTLCQASDGDFYDLGADEHVTFAPLAHVDDPVEREWALGWVEELLVLQGAQVTPEQRAALWQALSLMAARNHSRTLSGLCIDVQDRTLRDGLAHYTVGGGAGTLLDADTDSVRDSHFMVFEMEHLLNRGDRDLVPVLLYLFHVIDRRCRQGFPTFIPIDEAWLILLRSRFALKLEEWLRTKRRENARIWFVSQSLADVERSSQRHILVEACQTKIFLPNAEATTDQSAALYRALGLNEQQIEVVATAVPKQHYLYLSPYGRRLFDLQLSPVALAFTGVADRADLRRVRECMATYGAEWPAYWLRERGCAAEATWWQQWQQPHGQFTQEESHEHTWQDHEGGPHRNGSAHRVATDHSRTGWGHDRV